MKTGIWFGKLADGTEASISDLVMQDMTVAQTARVRLVNRQKPLDYAAALEAAQHLRQRFPELNREERASSYTETCFSRKNQSEEVASHAVKVTLLPASADPASCQEEAMASIDRLVKCHPSSLSRLGWCIDILHSLDGKDCVAWFIFSVSHSHADGVAMQAIVTDYLEAYSSLLQGKPLSARKRLPLYSALPRDRLSFSLSQRVSNGLMGWLAAKFIGKPGTPGPKLLTETNMKEAKRTQLERLQDGTDQREGPLHVDVVEMEAADTKKLCAHARSVGLTVGSLVHGSLFFALAKRFFQEHPEKDSLSLEVPMSMNVRSYLQPPLPNTVLAPQQGEAMVNLRTTRQEVDIALGNHKAMTPAIHKIALDSRSQVQAVVAKPKKLKPLEPTIFLASLLRNSAGKMHSVQYVGDAWLSNVGLYRPSATMKETMEVETTFTLNPTIVPAYELVWCNSTLGGSMALSMVTDETMGRNKASARALLEETKNCLIVLTQ